MCIRDRHKAFGSTTYTHEEYKTKFHDWLWEKYTQKENQPDGRWNWYGELNGSNDE